MTSYILAPEALQDLQELWDYIAAENLDAADRVMDTLFAAFERLATMPGLGHRREDLTDRHLRFWTVDAYLVAPHLTVVTMLHHRDKLLPATSNAVERGNRRHRTRQKSVCRIRSKACLVARIAFDRVREAHAEGRQHTTQSLHDARRGYA